MYNIVEAIKGKPIIAKIFTSPLSIFAFTILSFVSYEAAGWSHDQGHALLDSVNNPFFDKISSDFGNWWHYYFIPNPNSDIPERAAEYAALMRVTQLVSIAAAGAAGAGILKLGSSVLDWVKQKTKGAQQESGDDLSSDKLPQHEYPE